MLTHDIHVKTGTYGIQPVIHAVEGETGRFINIYTDDRAVTSSEEAELSIHRPDDSYYTDDHATVMPDSSEGQGFYHFSLVQALTRSGKVDCQLKISNNGLVLSTYTFYIIVEPYTTGLPVEQLGYDIYDLIDAAQQIQNVGLTEDIKQALLDCFAHVAWTDEHGQDYVDALEAALYPPATLVSISAVYTQSGTVYDTDTLDSLRDDLVVTAYYDNGTTQTVTTYTLSGTLEEGTSTITVNYGGKTDTFSVRVTHMPQQYTVTNNLTNVTNSNTSASVSEDTSYSGTLTANTGYAIDSVTITMGDTDITSTAYDDSDGSISIASVTGDIVITAEALEDVGYISGVPYTFTKTDGYNVDATTHKLVEASGYSYAILPCKYVDYISYARGSFGSGFTADFFDKDDNFLVRFTNSANGTPGITVDGEAHHVIISDATSKFPATITPYVYAPLGEQTIWEENTIYSPEEPVYTEEFGAWMISDYMFVYGADSISVAIGTSTSALRGLFVFYDATKTEISRTSSGNITSYGQNPNWGSAVEIPSGTYYVRISPASRYASGNSGWNLLIMLNRSV